MKFFGDIARAYFTDDPDRDQVNNLAEQALGSDPTNPQSNLWLWISRQNQTILLQWTSVSERSYTLQVSDDLRKFQSLKSGLAATPPVNTFELPAPYPTEPAFYRLCLDPASKP